MIEKNMKSILIAGLLLASAVPALAQTKSDVAYNACLHALHAGKLKTMVAFTRCANKAQEPSLRSTGKNQDVVDYFLAQRLAIAENVDRGRLTKIEGEAQIRSLETNLVSEIQRRSQAQAVVVQQSQQKAVTFCNTLGISTICY